MKNVLKRDIFVIEMDKWFVKFLNLFSLNSFMFYYELMKLDNESFGHEPLIWLLILWPLIFWTFDMTSDILNLWYEPYDMNLWFELWLWTFAICEPLTWTFVMHPILKTFWFWLWLWTLILILWWWPYTLTFCFDLPS